MAKTIANVTYFPPGTEVTGYKPGDFFLSTNDSIEAKLIKFGERRLFPHVWCWTNHAGRIVHKDGTIIEALARGLELNNISKYTDKNCVVVSPPFSALQRETVVRWSYGRWEEHVKYGFLHIACEALVCLTKTKLRFGIDGQMICSGFVAMGNAETGLDMGDDPGWVMPAELAMWFHVFAPTE